MEENVKFSRFLETAVCVLQNWLNSEEFFVVNYDKFKFFNSLSDRSHREENDVKIKILFTKTGNFFNLPYLLCIYTILHLSKLKSQVETFHEVVQ